MFAALALLAAPVATARAQAVIKAPAVVRRGRLITAPQTVRARVRGCGRDADARCRLVLFEFR